MDFYAAGKIIQAARKKIGLTQTQLGLRCGMSGAVISRAENGMYGSFSIRKYSQICQVLGLTLSVVPIPPPPTLETTIAEARKRMEEHPPTFQPDKIEWTRTPMRLNEQELGVLLANGAEVSKILRGIAPLFLAKPS